MKSPLENTLDILERLVGFKSVSGQPTDGITSYITDYLLSHGIKSTLSFDAGGDKANLFASIGPNIDGGVILNGHTDVVPVDGQQWQTDPFTLTRKHNKLYGRGSVDMKGFLACVLGSVPLFKQTRLKRPIHIAFTFDEEIGGLGMPVLLKQLSIAEVQADVVIVGEPTQMNIITGHKGGYEMRTEVTGIEVHSCDPRNGVNAISYAMKYIAKIDEIAVRLAGKPIQGSPFEPPYTTFNIGKISGGMARNATAGQCTFDWEIRTLPDADTSVIFDELNEHANKLITAMQSTSPTATIKTITEVAVPALNDKNATEATAFVAGITGLNSTDVVSFGTDAGYFSDAGYSTVIFGPGSISRAHKADEYIEVTEIEQGLAFLENVAQRLSKC